MKTIQVPRNNEDKYNFLRKLPDNYSLYKCSHCKSIFNISHGGQMNILTILKSNSYVYCPNCLTRNPGLMCKVDAYSIFLKLQGKGCRKGELIAGTELCPICEKPICPECYNHSVIALSRVTGYMSDIGGWNSAKKQELKDRQRYAIMA